LPRSKTVRRTASIVGRDLADFQVGDIARAVGLMAAYNKPYNGALGKIIEVDVDDNRVKWKPLVDLSLTTSAGKRTYSQGLKTYAYKFEKL
jgi:hypothetical protein